MYLKHALDAISTGWKPILEDLVSKHPYISEYLEKEEEFYRDALEIFPPAPLVFDAFNHFDPQDTKVIIIGQDPYINKGEAHGLCFSVPQGCKVPPSLRNVFKELDAEYGVKRSSTDLSDWADQGVLLVNTAFTVLEGKSGSHAKLWKSFTTDLFTTIAKNVGDVVVIMWGAHAQSFEGVFADTSKFLCLKHSHPSPLARKPFVGNGHFKACNEFLAGKGSLPIQWV